MAPTISAETLVKRYGYYCNGGYCYYGYSNWDRWGRWVALAVILVFALLVGVCFSCWNARRRRRRGLQPYYGTGWMANNGKPAQYQNNQAYYNNGGPAAPPYSPPVNQNYTGNTFNSADGYYGQQQHGIELQQPSNSYQPPRGGENVYSPPAGPPPGKTAY